MVGLEAALEIRVLHRHGKGIREIAREVGVSRNTVRRYLRDESAPRYKARPPRVTKLGPFERYVVDRLRAASPERIPGSVLLTELRERGYGGGYTRGLPSRRVGLYWVPAGARGRRAVFAGYLLE